MKKISALVSIGLFLLTIIGCSTNKDDLITMKRLDDEITLSYEGVEYSFYSTLENYSLKGKQIGVVEDEPEIKIYDVKGHDTRKWIIEYLDTGCPEMCVYKATDIVEIPSELRKLQ